MMIFGMSVSMFTIVSEIFKSSNYQVPSYYVYSGIEYNLFLLFSRLLRLSLSDLLILRNLGIITYLVAIMLFAITFSRYVVTKHQGIKPVGNIIRYIVLTAYPICYFLFYHPNNAFLIYLNGHRIVDAGQHEIWVNFITVMDYVMVLLACLYLIYPIILLIRNFLNNKISFFSEQLLGLALSISLLNGIFFFVFFTGAFKTSVNNVFKYAFWRYKLAVIVPDYYATIMPIISLAILMFILFITFKFKTDSMINVIRERSIRKNLSRLNSNLKDVLHSEKNIMFSIRILTEEALQCYGNDEGRMKLNKIQTLCDSHMDAVSKALNNIKELKVRTICNNLTDAIDTALKETTIPDNINLDKIYHDTNAFCNFDMYHMKQVIINLVSNAVDAINSMERSNANITITVDSSMDWIYLSIRDNGCGIPKRQIKKAFSPYYSTKSKQNNWGIGLSYVFRVINSHYGHVRIKSRPKEFTNVEILLPRSKADK